MVEIWIAWQIGSEIMIFKQNLLIWIKNYIKKKFTIESAYNFE